VGDDEMNDVTPLKSAMPYCRMVIEPTSLTAR
jgi:hypothetical protein